MRRAIDDFLSDLKEDARAAALVLVRNDHVVFWCAAAAALAALCVAAAGVAALFGRPWHEGAAAALAGGAAFAGAGIAVLKLAELVEEKLYWPDAGGQGRWL